MALNELLSISARKLELAVTAVDLSLIAEKVQTAASLVLGVTEAATPGVKFDYGAKIQTGVFQVKVEKQGPGWDVPTRAYINPSTVAQDAKRYLTTNADKLAPVYERLGLTRQQILYKEMVESAALRGVAAITQMYYNDSKGSATDPEVTETAIAIFDTALKLLGSK